MTGPAAGLGTGVQAGLKAALDEVNEKGGVGGRKIILKSLDDATLIRRRLLLAFEEAETASEPALRQRLLTFVLVGAGPTGVEMAGALAELAHATLSRDFRNINPQTARIILVEAGPRVLAGFPEKLSAFAAHSLERMGVEVLLDTPIEAIDDHGVTAKGGRIEGGERLGCEMTVRAGKIVYDFNGRAAVPWRDGKIEYPTR